MTSLAELDNNKTQLNIYFNALSLNLTSTSNLLPSFEDYNTLFATDSMMTDAMDGIGRGASYAIGALVDHIHLIAAIQREFNMRVKTRDLYFVDGQDDVNKMLDYVDFMHGSYRSYMSGKSQEQEHE